MSDEPIVEEPVVEEEPKETPEQELERLRGEAVTLQADKQSLLDEKAGLGRKQKELQDNYNNLSTNVAGLTEQLRQSQQPKEPDDGYLDLNDPKIAKQWFEQQVDERVKNDNQAQKVYADNYDKEIVAIMDKRGIADDEKKDILDRLEFQKEYKFGDAALDAERNFVLAREQVLTDRLNVASGKKINRKGDKAVSTGVGGSGTAVQVGKKDDLGPEAASLKDMFDKQKEQRHW